LDHQELYIEKNTLQMLN